jgi:predicted kinase
MSFYTNQNPISDKDWMESLMNQMGIKIEKKKLFVLVGPPAVGKSTWIKNTFKNKPYIINRDEIVDRVASSIGMTYDDMFVSPKPEEELGTENKKYGTVVKSPDFMKWQPLSYSDVLEANKKINKLLKDSMSNATKADSDIVVDMTNMTVDARKQALNIISGSDYKKIAVVFNFQGAEDIIKIISKKRSEEIKANNGSKTIPDHVLDRMMHSFQIVSLEEGFDEVVNVDNIDMLAKLAAANP